MYISKNSISSLLIIVLALSTIGYSLLSNSDKVAGTNPGYAEQFRIMKQNENGEMPSGLWKLWHKQKQSMGKTEFFSKVKELGPANIGGRARAIVVDLANPKRLLSGGVSGGIWISENSGSTWTPLDDAASTLSITAITQSPFNHKIFYYSTGEVSSGTHINYDGNGVFKSIDGGLSFKQLAATDTTYFDKTWDVVHSLTQENTIYVATVESGLWRSTDGGVTMEQLMKSSSDINDVDAMPDGTVYFTKEGAGLYKFTEADTVVIEQVNGTGMAASPFGRCMVAASPSNSKVIYVAYAGSDRESLKGIYKSTNGGTSFNKLTNRSQTSYAQIWHNFLLEVHPENPNFVVMAGVTGEYTSNGGTSWTALLNTHSDYHNAFFVPKTNNFYTVSDGGIYLCNTASANSSATNCNGNFNITQLYAGDYFPQSEGEKVIAGAQDNWTTINTSGGSVFSQVLGGDGAFNGISKDGATVYASSQNGEIRKSSNGGGWSNISYALKAAVGTADFWFINPFELHPTNSDNVFFPTKRAVARTTNGGSSWSKMTNDIAGNIFSVGITNEQNPTVYLAGQSSLLYRVKQANTATPGSEFKMFTLGPLNSRGAFIGNVKVDPNDNTTIYTAMSNSSSLPRIWKIEKADTDEPIWVDISSNLPDLLPVNWIEIDPKDSKHIMVATDYGVYITLNGGAWWEKEERIPNVYVSMLRLRASDRKLFVFTFGRGVWVADLEDNISSGTKNFNQLSVQIYPNPVADEMRIKGFESGQVTLVNLSGQEVFKGSLVNGSVDTKAIKAGTYFVTVTDASGKSGKAKVLIQK